MSEVTKNSAENEGTDAAYDEEVARIVALIADASPDNDNMDEADEAIAALAKSSGLSEEKVAADVSALMEADLPSLD